MKIFDCFTFYNELDLLDIRLAELHNSVDAFVIVEATTTFQNTPKSLYLKDNWDRYSAYHDKIIHVVVDDMPMSDDPWQNERFQRDAILRGLVNADEDDIAIIGDVDEILSTAAIDQIRTSDKSVYGLRMPYFNFKFNYMLVNNIESYCVWTTACKVGLLSSPEDLRRSRWDLNKFSYNYEDEAVKLIEHAGWHFTYLGNSEFIKNKLKSFAHNELNTDQFLSTVDVESSIAQSRGFNLADPRQFVPVAIDQYFPVTLQNKQQQYAEYIISNTTTTAKEHLPNL